MQSRLPKPEPRWVRAMGLSAAALLFGVPLLAIALIVAVWVAPFILAAIVWSLVYSAILRYDSMPYTYTRFAAALLVAWAADALLFRASFELPRSLHLQPAIVVVSIMVGFLAWNALHTEPTNREYLKVSRTSDGKVESTERVVTEHHPFAAFASFVAMLFLILAIVVPILRWAFPNYRWL